MVSYPLWVMWRYEHDAHKATECGLLVPKLEAEINRGLKVELGLSDQLKHSREETLWQIEANNNLISENRNLRGALGVQEKLTKHERVQKNKFKVGLGFAVLVIIGQIVFGK